MEMESKPSSGEPRKVEAPQSTVGIDIRTIDNISSPPAPPSTTPISITRFVGSDGKKNTKSTKKRTLQSSNSCNNNNNIRYVAWDLSGQPAYSTLHPVTKPLSILFLSISPRYISHSPSPSHYLYIYLPLVFPLSNPLNLSPCGRYISETNLFHLGFDRLLDILSRTIQHRPSEPE